MRTLLQILTDAQAFLDLDATSTPSGSDLTTRMNYANQAVREWGSYMQWRELSGIYYTYTSTLASISLPSDFREFMDAPRIAINSGYDFYPQIDPHEAYKHDASEKYCYVLGDPGVGYTAVFNNLDANATLTIDYQRYPSLFATLTDVCPVPDDNFLVARIEALVLKSRRDERFPVIDAQANQLLKNMGGRGDKTPPGGINQVPYVSNFRIGE